ncbi:sulfurtransferase complex subunit TusB [Colwellia echini]|uniref:Sulfurtransferase complex subunit TusB n=1 Tax=Colwellia echini TaxID=1982103 RepID=A0ABY3N079_9GAMM|nr:sulfurtransferase complex subunit TusB [Colwellia echini]TYK66850.1 sulfurtransferase complex subunit TusB [Colwellia echini]
MSTLHLVRQSAFTTNDFAQCINILGQRDTIVLMDDGCYNLKHTLLDTLLNTVTTSQLNVITSHARARAIDIQANVNNIEMSALVALTFTHQQVVTWQ